MMRHRLLEIFDLLLAHYGPLDWWPADSPFEVCIGAILTQNTNWGNVEKAIANLKSQGLLSAEALRDVGVEKLSRVIRPAGYYNLKSGRLKDFIEWLFVKYGGNLDEMFSGEWRNLRLELLGVRGIGPETADSILLYAGHKPTFVVDAYTKRLCSRLALIKEDAPYEKVRAMFMDSLPHEVPLFNEYHALIVEQCKRHCRKKPVAAGCPLLEICRCQVKSDSILSP